MKAVLLAGGLGTRMREETEYRPKPMVEIGGQPILWHIMRNLAHHGITDFVIASGYKSEVINQYFVDHQHYVQQESRTPDSLSFRGTGDESNWTVTVAFTGDLTGTGGRVARVVPLLDDAPFFVTYGDGLADVSIDDLRAFHDSSGCLATVTTVQPLSRFGVMDVGPDGKVTSFSEKPKLDGWINVGFFIMEPGALGYLSDNCVLEEEPLAQLAADRQLSAYRHPGFWQPMDTYRESKLLNDLWDSGTPPWRLW